MSGAYSDLYNYELKRRFLLENDFADDERRNIYYTLRRTSVLEKSINKDIYEMNQKEITDLFHTLESRSISLFRKDTSYIRLYLEWCIGENYIPHQINYVDFILRNAGIDELKIYLSKSALENQIISLETLDGYIKELIEVDNYQDALILYLLFCGVELSDTNDELSSITPEDVDFENRVIKTSVREIKFDYLALNSISIENLLKEAMVQETSLSGSLIRELKTLMKFNSHGYLIKSIKRFKSENEKITYAMLTSKIRTVAEYLNNIYLNIYNIHSSGYIYYIKNYIENYDADDLQVYDEVIEYFKLDIKSINLRTVLLPYF